MKTPSIEREENKFFPVNQLHIHCSTGVRVPIHTALLSLSKALLPRDTEVSRSTRSAAVLTPLALKSDFSQQWRQGGNL